jgi:hypothetical protein
MNEIILNEVLKPLPLTADQKTALAAHFPSRRMGRKMVVLLVEPGSPFKIEPGNVFPTLASLAIAMGLNDSVPLCQYLRLTNGAPAKLRGVTFQYLTDYQKGQQP